jgi:hypothetical protein
MVARSFPLFLYSAALRLAVTWRPSTPASFARISSVTAVREVLVVCRAEIVEGQDGESLHSAGVAGRPPESMNSAGLLGGRHPWRHATNRAGPLNPS